MRAALTKIALCGPMRAGKNAVSAHLAGTYGFEEYALADSLKETARKYYPQAFEQRNAKPRRLLQTFGEHLCAYDPDIFINATLRTIAVTTSTFGFDRVVITDLRKQREFDRLKALGFTVIRVIAPEELRLARAQAAGDVFSAEDMRHSTETAVSAFDVDYEVRNDGTLDELWTQVDGIMRDLHVSPRRVSQ